MSAPRLHASSRSLQIVDGNNYILKRLYSDISSFSVRGIIEEIRACPVPPVFVFDGPRSLVRRRKVYPEYKAAHEKRNPKTQPVRDQVFPILNMLIDLVKLTHAVSLRVPGFEADDVIAALALAEQRPVEIVSTDQDFLQLLVHPHVSLQVKTLDVEPRFVRLYKTMVGDHSDGVPGMRSFGPSKWARLDKIAALRAFTTRQTPSPGNPFGISLTFGESFSTSFASLLPFWDVVGFLPVDYALLTKHIHVGVADYAAIDNILKGFFQ